MEWFSQSHGTRFFEHLSNLVSSTCAVLDIFGRTAANSKTRSIVFVCNQFRPFCRRFLREHMITHLSFRYLKLRLSKWLLIRILYSSIGLDSSSLIITTSKIKTLNKCFYWWFRRIKQFHGNWVSILCKARLETDIIWRNCILITKLISPSPQSPEVSTASSFLFSRFITSLYYFKAPKRMIKWE